MSIDRKEILELGNEVQAELDMKNCVRPDFEELLSQIIAIEKRYRYGSDSNSSSSDRKNKIWELIEKHKAFRSC